MNVGEGQIIERRAPIVVLREWVAGRWRRLASQQVRRALGLLLAVGISTAIFVFREELIGLEKYGYPGLFLLNLLASATLILPVPGLALAFAAGSTFNPILVGLATGSGSTLGELTGYLAGYSGRGVIENRAQYEQVRAWLGRYGLWVFFVLSAIPNPVFDIAGITAGAMRIPVWQFLVATWAGKLFKFTLVAYAGVGTVNLLGPLIQALSGR